VELIKNGAVLNANHNAPAKPSQKVLAGETWFISLPATEQLELNPIDLQIPVLYEDSELAVVYKRAGLSVHPSATDTGPTLVHGLLHGLKSLSSIGGVARPGIVHRIDKGTSGILVVSKTDRSHLALSAQFKAHSIIRKYKALLWKSPRAKLGHSGRFDTEFGRHPVHRKKMTTKPKGTSKRAITNWALLHEYKEGLALVECRLETGRTHQIRVHFSESGHPLVGDPVYGNGSVHLAKLQKHNPIAAQRCRDLDHQLLHAEELGFLHPLTQETMHFRYELPDDFNRVLESLHD
jgi:23S rRNA pseudouridine1911/1915/1917 synthase